LFELERLLVPVGACSFRSAFSRCGQHFSCLLGLDEVFGFWADSGAPSSSGFAFS